MTPQRALRLFAPRHGVLVLGLLLAACVSCTSASPPALTQPPAAAQPPRAALKVQLSWLKDAQSAGEFEALSKSYYAAENLDVELLAGGPSINNIQTVAGGQAQVGIVGGPSGLLLARNQNIPVRVFAATDDKSASALTCRPEANVRKFADLKGKTIGATATQRVNVEAL